MYICVWNQKICQNNENYKCVINFVISGTFYRLQESGQLKDAAGTNDEDKGAVGGESDDEDIEELDRLHIGNEGDEEEDEDIDCEERDNLSEDENGEAEQDLHKQSDDKQDNQRDTSLEKS